MANETEDYDVDAELSLPELLKVRNMTPAKTTSHVNGTTTWTWHVDNDDDRYVQVTDSVKRPPSFLVVSRDEFSSQSCVVTSPSDVLTLVCAWTSWLSVGTVPASG